MRNSGLLCSTLVIGFFLLVLSMLAMAGLPPRPQADTTRIKSASPVYMGETGIVVLKVLSEIKDHSEHYNSQAHNYEQAVLGMRIAALVCSVLAAAVLALSGTEWSRRTALLFSIISAALPAVDQTFHVSDMHRASWRAAVDVTRLFNECRDKWELIAAELPDDKRQSVAEPIVSRCRGKLEAIVDAEMDTSMKPLQLPIKVEVK